MPNSLYTVAVLLDNETLLNDSPAELTISTTGDQSVPVILPKAQTTSVTADGTTSLVGLSSDEINTRPTVDTLSVNDSSGSMIISQYLCNEPTVLEALCAAAPPHLALNLFESTLSEQQLQCFKFCYERAFHLDKDSAYSSWMKYRIASETANLTPLDEINSMDISVASLPEIDNSSIADELDISLKELIPTTESCHTIEASGNEQLVADCETLNQLIIVDQLNKTTTDDREQRIPLTVAEHVLDRDTTPGVAEHSNVPQACSSKDRSYPFRNRSFPGDSDSDILPYPDKIIRKQKTQIKQKYFLLTSKEAHETKLKETEDKLLREKEKEERAKTRKDKLKEKELRDLMKSARKSNHEAFSDTKSSSKKNKSNTNEQNEAKNRKSTKKKDRIPCGICGIMCYKDKSCHDWIQCCGCGTWYHNGCQGLEENEYLDGFLCITCNDETF
jgi:hypothetical protein